MSMDGPVRAEKSGVETWRYSLPNENGEGWAIIFMDETGCFAALSDWGDVSYRWNSRGLPEGGFKRFMTNCDDYYLTGKFGQGRKEYDAKGSLENAKDAIIQARRDGDFDKEKARDEWELLDRYDDLENEMLFHGWYTQSSLDDASECYCQHYVSDVTQFVAKVMPRLRAVLRAELGIVDNSVSTS